MLCSVNLRGAIVYLPTMARLDAGGHRTIEPVEVVPVSDSTQLREAFARCFARGNPMRAMPKSRAEWGTPIMPKYAGVKNSSAWEKGLSEWDIKEDDGAWQIIGRRKRQGRGTEEDFSQQIVFPAGTTASEVIDRMIAILQEKAGLPA
jgi:hypothetical protein